jgi:hypothetical protein
MDYWPEIVGLTFGQLPELFPDAIVCGVCDEFNRVLLNPNSDYVMKELDELVVIAEAATSYQPYPFLLGFLDASPSTSSGPTFGGASSGNGTRRNSFLKGAVSGAVSGISQTLQIMKAVKQGFDAGVATQDGLHFIGLSDLRRFCQIAPPVRKNDSVSGEKFLIIGWRRDLRDVLVALDEIVGPGTLVYLFDDLTRGERDDSLSESGDFNTHSLRRITLVHQYGNPVSRRDLEKLHKELNLLQVTHHMFVISSLPVLLNPLISLFLPDVYHFYHCGREK